MRYVALDFETANSSPCSACSVGVSIFDDQTLRRSESHLLRPPKPHRAFHWYNIKVHGITPAMVKDAPPFSAVWPQLRPEIEGAVVVCHNAMFDTAVLCKTLAYYALDLPRCRYICTVKVAQKVWPELPNHKLDTVSAALGIALQHHEAGSDALACGKILQAALRQTGSPDADSLAEKIGMRLGGISPEGCVSCSTAQEIARQRQRAVKEQARAMHRQSNMDRSV